MGKETVFGFLNIFKERNAKKTWEYLNNPDKAYWRKILPFEKKKIYLFMDNSLNSKWEGHGVFYNKDYFKIFSDVGLNLSIDRTSGFLRVRQNSNNVADKLSPQIFLQLDRERNDINLISSQEDFLNKSTIRSISSCEEWGLGVYFVAENNNAYQHIHFGRPVTNDCLNPSETVTGDLRVEKELMLNN